MQKYVETILSFNDKPPPITQSETLCHYIPVKHIWRPHGAHPAGCGRRCAQTLNCWSSAAGTISL